jgi:rhodanese-related sulfurtransferase
MKKARKAEGAFTQKSFDGKLVMEPLRISVEEMLERVEAGEPLLVIDARPRDEWDRSDMKIPGAVHVPPGEVENHLESVARWHLIITYCVLPDEAASTRVARELMANGRHNVRPLRGGLIAWQQAGYPVEIKPVQN